MRYSHLLAFIVAACTSASAQIDYSTQHQSSQFHLLQIQNDLNLARIQAETNRIQQETNRIWAEIDQERKLEQLNNLITQQAERESEAAKKAEEAVEALQAERELASAGTLNTTYLVLLAVLLSLLGILIAKKAHKEGLMKYEQKFGTVLMVGGILASFIAILMSDGWIPRLDVFQNIVFGLRIKMFAEHEGSFAPHLIDIPTKHVLVIFFVMIAYGFTTYLGITPAWKKKELTEKISDH